MNLSTLSFIKVISGVPAQSIDFGVFTCNYAGQGAGGGSGETSVSPDGTGDGDEDPQDKKGEGSADGGEKVTLDEIKKNPPTHQDYKAPKSGDRKVKNPNGSGSGWIDSKGRVWVPTDHKGTHAPHWDVQEKDGTHTNVYPFTIPAEPVGIRIYIGLQNTVRAIKDWWTAPSVPCNCE